MNKKYLIPDLHAESFYRAEQIIKRSRFVVTLAHTPTPESAKLFIEQMRNEFPDATHNCWAFVAGAAGDSGRAGYSDDGEPHGTAGRPMLTVLLHCGIGEITAVVTRYFGGTKLGTGGLVRAYQDLVRLGLEGLPSRLAMQAVRVQIILDYNKITLFKRQLSEFRASVVQENFATEATYEVLLPEENLDPFLLQITELTDGDVLTEILQTERI